ncbi:hypothetical protein ACTXT7_010993 [Hymenolepis weldensis]
MKPLGLFAFLALCLCATAVFSLPALDAKMDEYLIKTHSKRSLDEDLLKAAKQHIYKSIDQIFQLVSECKERGIAASDCEMVAIAKVDKDREGDNRNRERYGEQEPTNDPSRQQQPFSNSHNSKIQQIEYPSQPNKQTQHNVGSRFEYTERPNPRNYEGQGNPRVLQSYSNAQPPFSEKPRSTVDLSHPFQRNQSGLTGNAQDLTRPWFPQQHSEKSPIPSNPSDVFMRRDANSARQGYAQVSTRPWFQQQQSSNNYQRPPLVNDPSDGFMRRDQGSAQGLTKPYAQHQIPYYRDQQPPYDPDKPHLAIDPPVGFFGQNPYSAYPQPRDSRYLNGPNRAQIASDPTETILGRNSYSGYQSSLPAGHQRLAKPCFPQSTYYGHGEPQISSGHTEADLGPMHHRSVPFSEQTSPVSSPGVQPRFESIYVSASEYPRPATPQSFDPPVSVQNGIRVQDGVSNTELLRGTPVTDILRKNFMNESNQQDSRQVTLSTSDVHRRPLPANLEARPYKVPMNLSGIAVLPTKDPSSAKPNIDPNFNISRSPDGILNIQTGGKVYQIDPSKMLRARTGGHWESTDYEELQVAVPDISSNFPPSLESTKELPNSDEPHSQDGKNITIGSTKILTARTGRKMKLSLEGINVQSDPATHDDENVDPDPTKSEDAEAGGSKADSLRARAFRSAEDEDEVQKADKEIQVSPDVDMQFEE